MKKQAIILLISAWSAMHAEKEWPRGKLNSQQIKVQRLLKSAQENEAKICEMLQEVEKNPIAAKPEVQEWLNYAYTTLDDALERSSICSKKKSKPIPVLPPSPKPVPAAAPEIAPQIPDAEIPFIFNQINNIIAKNKFKPREQWSSDDQEEVNQLIKKAQVDKNLAQLIEAYFKDYQAVKKLAQLALQAEQAVNFLYIKPLNDNQVNFHKENLKNLGANATAKAIDDWLEPFKKPLHEEQREERERAIKDILDVSKVLEQEPHELWLEKIKKEASADKKEELEKLNNIRENFILEVGHEKEPANFRTLIKNITELNIKHARQEADQLRYEIEKQLKIAQAISDEEAINRLATFVQDAENRDLGYTLVRILKEAERNDEQLKQQRMLIDMVRDFGSSHGFIKLKEFKKEGDEKQSKLVWPTRLPFEFSQEQKQIKRK